MSRQQEDELATRVSADPETVKKVCALLEARRERYKTSLEGGNDEVVRGRSQECRDLIKLLRN